MIERREFVHGDGVDRNRLRWSASGPVTENLANGFLGGGVVEHAADVQVRVRRRVVVVVDVPHVAELEHSERGRDRVRMPERPVREDDRAPLLLRERRGVVERAVQRPYGVALHASESGGIEQRMAHEIRDE